MTFRLNRNQFFGIGIVVVIIFLLLNRFEYIIGSDTTTGTVLYTRNWTTKGRFAGRYDAPVIQFTAKGYVYTFQGTTNLNVAPDEKVRIIYKTGDPTEAHVYSFGGFWVYPLIYALVPLMLLVAAVYSFLKEKDSISVHIGKKIKFFKTKGDRGGSVIGSQKLNE